MVETRADDVESRKRDGPRVGSWSCCKLSVFEGRVTLEGWKKLVWSLRASVCSPERGATLLVQSAAKPHLWSSDVGSLDSLDSRGHNCTS